MTRKEESSNIANHDYTVRVAKNVAVHIFLAVLALIWLFPLIWLVLISFRDQAGSAVQSFWPGRFSLDNYNQLLFDTNVLNFPRAFANTLIISIFSMLISTLFVLSVAFSTSRLRFKVRRPLMNLGMILGLFPGFMAMIAVYYILKALGLTQGGLIRVALIMVYSGSSGMGFYIAKGFFDTIPKSLDEAAILDGATRFQVFRHVTIPLSKPIIVYTVLTAFMGPWLDFVFARVIVRANSQYDTVALILWRMLEKEYINRWFNSFMAGAVLVSIPIATVFMIMQRYYRDNMGGAVKG